MREVLKFFGDIRFYAPIVFIILFELFLQSGAYAYIQKPRSAAKNVLNIVKYGKKSKLKPNLLVLGTSVAFEGVNLQLLNQKLKANNMRAQSGACESNI